MQITGLSLQNFRNHKSLTLAEIDRVLLIVGANATGKTNIIEALQLVSMQESFRKPRVEELTCWQAAPNEPCKIKIEFIKQQEEHTKEVRFLEGKKIYVYNNKERPAHELSNLLPAVLFTPDDLSLIKGAPEKRRDFIDSLGARISPTFAHICRDYARALKQKNRLLKEDNPNRELIESWNYHLVEIGNSLQKHRQGLFNKVLAAAQENYRAIVAQEELSGCYLCSYDTKTSSLQREIEEHYEAEIAAKRALIGPHRDDLCFYINERDTRRFASQGQQRSAALALKIAEIDVLRRVLNTEPLLLLDDVMSELDEQRRACFIAAIGPVAQTVITTTNLGYFNKDFLAQAKVFNL